MNTEQRTAPRVTPDMITAAIVNAAYHLLPDTQITVCVLTLRNGTRLLGYNYGSIDPAKQDWEQGRQAAYEMAREKIWELEGYALRERLAFKPEVDTALPMNGTPQRVSAIINGYVTNLDPMPNISYERLCEEAGKHPHSHPTVVYSLPDGNVGGLVVGEVAPLVEGGIYNVMVTGNA